MTQKIKEPVQLGDADLDVSGGRGFVIKEWDPATRNTQRNGTGEVEVEGVFTAK